jgi:hypothetical protein
MVLESEKRTCGHVLHDADAKVLVHHGVQATDCAT